MITCDKSKLYYKPVMWLFELIQKAYGVNVVGDDRFDVKIGCSESSDIQLSSRFYNAIFEEERYDYEQFFGELPFIRLDNGQPDYISTIFYLVNGIQEFELAASRTDRYGRLDYKASLQYRFGILEKDLVKEYIALLLQRIDRRLKLPESKSMIIVSHDIDSVYGSLKYDGLWALKGGHIGFMMKISWQTAMTRPPWFNIDKVADLNDSYGVKSCYYWIVQNGRDALGIKNGDYNFQNKKIQHQLAYARSLGNEIGIHKSTMDTGFAHEVDMMPQVKSNRFHFLKIDNPHSYSDMEAAGIESDSSVGFAYVMGFKNSFGLPYYPFDLKSGKTSNVLEIPLHIMDGMFDIHDKASGDLAYRRIVDFIETHKMNTLISILWHNSELTPFAYGWSFDCYKKLLQYFYDQKIETVLPSQLVEEYKSA